MLNRNEFLTPIPLKTKTIQIEGFGDVQVQEMSAAESAKFEMFVSRDDSAPDRKLKLITLCVTDEDGERLLTEADFPELRNMPANIINRLGYEVMLINDFLKADSTQEEYDEEFAGKSVA